MSTSSAVLFSRLLARARLRQLQLIQEVASLGSLQRAAEAVNLSQPAATHALADIESLLGMPLFERHAKGTRPTAAGAAVVPRIRQALLALAECADIVSSMHAGASGVLRIGAIGAAISGLLSRALPAFSERFPAMTLNVRQLSPAQLIRELLEETIDIAILRRPDPLPAETEFHEVISDFYAVVCSPRHPSAGQLGLTMAQLAQQLWLMPPTSTIAERDFHQLWAPGQAPQKLCWVESQSPLMLWSMLEQRQALALVPFNAVRQSIDAGVLAVVPGSWGPPLTPVGVLVRSERLTSQAATRDLLLDLKRWGDAAAGTAAVA